MEYHTIEHTADVGIEVSAASLEELFSGAAEGMLSIMLGGAEIAPTASTEVEIQAGDLAELMFKWLNELIFLVGARGLALGAVQVRSVTAGGDGRERGAAGDAAEEDGVAATADDAPGRAASSIAATVGGVPLDEVEGSLETEIKAATYHELSVERRDGAWRARVIFDV